jgi:hypothetical protein
MENTVSYEDDTFLWSQQQASVLRRLARTRRDLPNELDLENIAEEIEDVGRSQLNAVTSNLALVLAHLLKIASVADEADPVRHWRSEILNFHTKLSFRFMPGMRQNIDLGRIWRSARSSAAADLESYGQSLIELPQDCPLELDLFLGDTIDINALVSRIRALAVRQS